MADLYAWINACPAALAEFNHPGRKPYLFDDFRVYDSVTDHFFADQTGDKSDTNSKGEYPPYLTQALSTLPESSQTTRWWLAPVYGHDNHNITTVRPYRTVYVGPALTRSDLYEAMEARRLYSSDDDDLVIAFLHGSTWMGSAVTADSGLPTAFTVMVGDDDEIDALQLLACDYEFSVSSTPAATISPPGGTTSLSWAPEVTDTDGDCFFVKANSADGDAEVTSAI